MCSCDKLEGDKQEAECLVLLTSVGLVAMDLGPSGMCSRCTHRPYADLWTRVTSSCKQAYLLSAWPGQHRRLCWSAQTIRIGFGEFGPRPDIQDSESALWALRSPPWWSQVILSWTVLPRNVSLKPLVQEQAISCFSSSWLITAGTTPRIQQVVLFTYTPAHLHCILILEKRLLF